ncbi:MAG: hypothetical protein RLZ80_616 [Actinomycetota bacterium]|jgi:hypothetical protein
MWITVENKRISGDYQLGISKLLLKGFTFTSTFPQLSPQSFFGVLKGNSLSKWEEFCNYKKVISLTHISTAVITTNYLNKTFLSRVPRMSFQGAV